MIEKSKKTISAIILSFTSDFCPDDDLMKRKIISGTFYYYYHVFAMSNVHICPLFLLLLHFYTSTLLCSQTKNQFSLSEIWRKMFHVALLTHNWNWIELTTVPSHFPITNPFLFISHPFEVRSYTQKGRHTQRHKKNH